MGNTCRGTGIPELTEKDIEFLVNNTKKDKETIMEGYETFLENSPTGKVDRSQFAGLYKMLYPDGDPDRFGDHVFRAFDTDGNGYIDFKEFMLAIYATSGSTIEDKIRLV